MHNKMKIALFSIISLVLMLNLSGADAASFCGVLFSPGNVLSGTSPYSILFISLVIMLIMAIIAGIAFAIGYAIKIDKLVRFAKSELGEILITILIVFVFVGTFELASASTPSSMFTLSKGTFSNNIYMSDCTNLYGVSLSFISPGMDLIIIELGIKFISSIKVSVLPVYFGISFSPFIGLSVINNVINVIINIAGAFAGIMIAVIFLMAVVYKLFPIFFFVGIVLRTIPWTRAAGGAFIGLFVAFYIALPLLLYALISGFAVSPYIPGTLNYSVMAELQNITPAIPLLSLFTELISFIPQGIVTGFIENVLSPALFYFVAVLISIIISYNLMEALGDLLGAPSLSSRNTLKKLL
ncbi:MAG: hypothetical protein ACP5TL_00655 [Candidatus Micrarchaeia archaeon]